MPTVVRDGIPASPTEPRVYSVAFWKVVWVITSSASVAIAIVDSVIRMIAPPKTAATTSATSADSSTAMGSPTLASARNPGSSGSCAALTAGVIDTSAVV